MENFPIIIDITKGGIIDKGGSFVWWLADLGLFNNGAWWSWKDAYYNKYKVFLDKFPLFEGGRRFRQTELYDLARADENLVNVFKLIWIDMVSNKYELQKEVCAELRKSVETELMLKLEISQEDIDNSNKIEDISESINTSKETLDVLSSALSIDTSTGEVVE